MSWRDNSDSENSGTAKQVHGRGLDGIRVRDSGKGFGADMQRRASGKGFREWDLERRFRAGIRREKVEKGFGEVLQRRELVKGSREGIQGRHVRAEYGVELFASKHMALFHI